MMELGEKQMAENGVRKCILCHEPMDNDVPEGMDVCKTCGSKVMQRMGRKGGTTTKERHGEEHYKKIGKMGGQKVRELVERGKKGLENE
jgi:uncharacterized protein